MKHNLRSLILPAVAALLSIAAAGAKADTFTLSPIAVDTSSLQGTQGYLEFAYDVDGNSGSNPLTSTVSVTGNRISPFSLDNSGFSSFQVDPFTFGKTLVFTPTFSYTPDPSADQNSLFTVYALDNNYNPFTTNDPSGLNAILSITQTPDGKASAPAVYSPFVVAPVPEASTVTTFALLSIGFVGVLCLRRRRTE